MATMATALEPEDEEESPEQATAAERRAEAWMMHATGSTMTAIGNALGVSRQRAGVIIKEENARRRGMVADIDAEAERLIGQLEAVATKAWESQRAAGTQSMAGPQYLRVIVDAVKEIARFRGIEAPKGTPGTGNSRTEVIVRIGGTSGASLAREPVEAEAIEVGVRTAG